jgi:hypothetical protein
VIIAVPVILTALLAADSNRPEIGYEAAGRGSLHPANLLMLAFADLFGASDVQREFWGPPAFPGTAPSARPASTWRRIWDRSIAARW